MAIENDIHLNQNEHIILVVKRTKLGLIPLALAGIVVLLGILAAVFAASRYQEQISRYVPISVIVLALLVLAILVVIMFFISFIVYIKNELVLTNENLIQVLQRSLFNRSISHLNLEDIQDVTFDQHGILPSLFNFGTVRIETAGEQANFIFPLADNPARLQQQIMSTHDELVGTGYARNNNSPAAPQSSFQSNPINNQPPNPSQDPFQPNSPSDNSNPDSGNNT